ncbi:hypothetical protein GCM10009077_32140 [Roseibium denhamense]|uniref:Uncharacterized protein n=1 Tax=Roseibium denhamense TaxID=76305 RepID=A0ABY1NWQ3_9HYPH|nr:hypothetical protein SAMN06265374_1981 [Roseibium denhamense]
MRPKISFKAIQNGQSAQFFAQSQVTHKGHSFLRVTIRDKTVPDAMSICRKVPQKKHVKMRTCGRTGLC